MSPTPKVQHRKMETKSKKNRTAISIFRIPVELLYRISKYHFPAALFILIIIVFMGDLLTETGLIFALLVLIFILLHFLILWLKKLEEK